MTDARAEILERIRTALADRPEPTPVARDYRGPAGAGDVDLFVERVDDYKATVHRDVSTDDVLRGLEAVAGLPMDEAPLMTRLAQGPLLGSDQVGDPLADRA